MASKPNEQSSDSEELSGDARSFPAQASQPASSDSDAAGNSSSPGTRGPVSRRRKRNSLRSKKQRDSSNPGSRGNSSSAPAEATVAPGTASSSVSQPSSTPREPNREDESRYEAIGELGRGGWGVVQRAIDKQLEREVAVKRIGNAAKVSAEVRQRFMHEAKITSQLQHPGIVPVHELGGEHTSDGDAFYVMKLLEGDTLRHEIRLIHERLKAVGPKPSTIEFHDAILPLLHRFVDICHAVGYAHSRGVIHRDLKPANVMIGRFGETIVVDWGLAKQVAPTGPIANSDTTPSHVLLPEESTRSVGDIEQELDRFDPLSKQSDWNSGVQTSQGSIVGTPAYMSPEQANGDERASHPAADLYSLGVILHEILVGRHPFADRRDVNDVLLHVRAGTWESPKQSHPWVPRPLAAISSTAMQIDPADRYASAQEIADEVQRYIAGDAVEKDQETLVDHVARWCRHHRTLATTTMAVLTVGLIAAICIAAVIRHSHGVERAAREQAQASQAEAMSRLTQTREAADAWLIDLSGALQFYPGLQPIREKLIQDAIGEYESLLASTEVVGDDFSSLTPHDPLRLKQRQLHHQRMLEQIQCDCRLGDLYRLSGKHELAHKHYRRAGRDANSLRDALNSSTPTSRSFGHRVCCEEINARIGQLLLSQFKRRDSSLRQCASDSRLLTGWLQANSPASDFDLWCKSASCLSRLSFVWAQSESTASQRAAELMSVSASWAQQLFDARESDADARWVQTVAMAQAGQLAESGRQEECLTTWRALINHLDALCTKHPSRIDFRQSLANARLQLANNLSASADTQSLYSLAVDDLHHSMALADADEFYLANLARAKLGLGRSISVSADNQEEAHQHLRQSIRLHQQLLQREVTADALRGYCQAHLSLIELNPPLPPSQRIPLIDAAELALDLLRDHQMGTPEDERTLVELKRLRMRLAAEPLSP
ncbi:MAG: serine/threonine-protein kinase [Rubripirellula sp.]